ncbi:T9SS type A sorting domain-containing protein [Bacteroidota bacterium]
MKQLSIIVAMTCLLITFNNLEAQTTWTGSIVTFTKADNADWTIEANQDRITSNVWITRASSKGIFNIVTETEYSTSSSPADTEWALGTTANIGSLSFQNFQAANGSDPQSMIGQDWVLHLITDDIYIDIKFTAYSGGGTGGGFSYERTSDQSVRVDKFESNSNIKLYPNPSNNYLQISNLSERENLEIFSVLGKKVFEGTISNDEKIDIHELQKGLYLLKFENGSTHKFIKE